MANFNVTLLVGIGKGSAASTWSTVGNVGHTSGDPIDVNIGDTVTFIRDSNSVGVANVKLLNIFTSNTDIALTTSVTSTARTVASGGTTLDTITGYNQNLGRADNLYLERQAASADTTPNSFDFTNQTGVTRSSVRTSANTVTIAGMDSGASTSVSMSGGTYSKNSGGYTSASTTAVNGTTFKLRHTSSGSYSTGTTSTLTVGGVAGSFVSTTEAAPSADNTPDAFNIADISGTVSPGSVATSASATITGMDSGTACSVSGASSQLEVAGSGTYSTTSTINPGQTIRVRLTASTSFSTAASCTLTIGTVTDTISVTSGANTSGGGGTGTSGGSGSYGFQVFDTNGTTTVLSPSTRYMTRLTDPVSISINSTTPSSSVLISVAGMSDLTAANSDLVMEYFSSSTMAPVTRESNGFRITNNSSGVFTNLVYAVRF